MLRLKNTGSTSVFRYQQTLRFLEAIMPVGWVRIAPSPRKKAREDCVKDCTYCARHPRNPHRRSPGLGAAHGHVPRSPALRTTPSRSARTQHRPRPGCPRIQQTHIWKGEDVIHMCRMTPAECSVMIQRREAVGTGRALLATC